jgi:hypothetical protein
VGLCNPDPDGYVLHFESATTVPEENKYSEWKKELAIIAFITP